MKNQVQEGVKTFFRNYISPAVVDATFSGVFDISDGYKIYAKPDFPTAATYFDENEKKHIIFIGTDMNQYVNSDTHESRQSLVRSLLIHELGHTLFTHVDSKSLNKKLKDAGVPFSLFNLAEDARIEKLIKEKINKESGINYVFEWERWFVSPEIDINSNPESILFLLINTEGKDSGTAMQSIRVREYYERFLSAKTSYHVIDILNEWVDEFGKNPNNSPAEQASQRMQDTLQEVMEAAENALGESFDGEISSPDEGKNQINAQLRPAGDIGEPVENSGCTATLSEMLEDAVEMEELSMLGSESDTSYTPDVSFNTVTLENCSSTDAIFNPDNREKEYYPSEVKKIEKALRKLTKKEKERVATKKPTNRFNSGRMFGALTDPAGSKLYTRRRERNSKKTKKNIMFVLDLSGSMSGVPIRSARTLMIGANKIAQREKHLNITILGSKVSAGAMFQTIKLPANEKELISVSADGSSEGIGYALEKSQKEVSKNDIVVFLTDGMIHDREISKKYIGKFLKKGAISIGIYTKIDNTHVNTHMKEWFDELIVRDNIVEIIERVVEIANKNDGYMPIKKIEHSTDDEISASVSPR